MSHPTDMYAPELPQEFYAPQARPTTAQPTMQQTVSFPNYGDLSRPKGASTSTAPATGNGVLDNSMDLDDVPVERSAWSPRSWGRKTWAAVGTAIVVIILAVVLGCYYGVKPSSNDSKYPDYSKLNYTLVDTYGGPSFFDNFDYYTGYDPAGGFVHYVDSVGSEVLNLTYATSESAILQVDTSDHNATTGRKSARITSKKQYNNGLFIFDIKRIPYGCSLWPSLWLSDPSDWPNHGEIDIIEGVNNGVLGTGSENYIGNQATLHTTGSCKMDVKKKETGTLTHTDCHNTTDDNAGCGVVASNSSPSYGAPYNAVGGGVYAMEWRSAGIRVWSWDRTALPTDIQAVLQDNGTSTTSTPDPSTWSEPMADFPNTHCDIDSHFANQSIIADIDFCGGWAASSYYYDTIGSCPGTCFEYVADGDFSNAVWEWGGWWVYQAGSS